MPIGDLDLRRDPPEEEITTATADETEAPTLTAQALIEAREAIENAEREQAERRQRELYDREVRRHYEMQHRMIGGGGGGGRCYGGGDGSVQINIDYNPMMDARVIAARVQGLQTVHQVTDQYLHETPFDHIARDMAQSLAREVERRVFEQIMRLQPELRRERRYEYERPRMRRRDHDEIHMYIGGGSRPKPKKAKHFKWMRGLPEEITVGDCKANLLNDSMKVYREGKDMRHCLHDSYQDRIADGRYLVYHADVPRDICKSGLTIGYSRNLDGSWMFDQSKVKANSTQDDPRLDALYEEIGKQLNKEVKETKQRKQYGRSPYEAVMANALA